MVWERALRPSWQRYLGVALLVSLTLLVRMKYLSTLEMHAPFLLSYPLVIVAAVYAGFRAGVLTTLITAAFSSLFLEPIGELDHAHAWIAIAVFISIGILISYLFEALFRTHAQLVDTQARLASERENASAAITQGEERFRTLADNISQLAWMADEKGWLVWYNKRWFDYTGSTLEEMQGWGWKKVHHPDHVDRVTERFQHSLDTGEPWEDTFPLRGADGRYRWFLSRALPVRDSSGRITRWFGTNTDITEQREAQEALRESERLIRKVMEAMPIGVWIADRNGKLQTGNPAGQQIWAGRRYMQIEQLDHCKAWRPDTGKRIAPDEWAVTRAIRYGETTLNEELEIECLDGTRRVILNSVTPVFDERKRIIAAIAVNQDITERKRMEEELRRSRDELELRVKQRTAELADANMELWQSEERLRLVLEGSQLGFWDWNIETGEVKRNERWAEMLGYTLEEIELNVRQWTDLHHPDDRAAAWKSIEDHIEGRTPFHELEYRMRAKDGSYRWILDRAKVVRRDSQGRPLRMSGTHTDITERKQMQEALRRSEEKFFKAFHFAPLMMALSRIEDGVYLEVNERFIELSGFSREEVIGKSSLDLAWISAEDRRKLIGEIKAKGRVEGTEITLHTKDGQEVHCLYNGELIETDTHPVLLSIAQDITRLKQAEEELKAYALELERSNRELEDFAFISSHDLHEPLRKIQAFSDRIRTKYGDILDDQGRDWLERIHRAAHRMRALVDDLLKYSRLTTRTEPLAPVSLKEPVEDAVRDLKVLMEETGGRIEMGDLPTIEADPVQMRQLFQNLIGNSLKFHGSGLPHVTITCSEQANGTCRILVKDRGIGFDEKYLDRIFRPFQQLHQRDEYDGTGMGLAICRKIVERHGGAITATSELGEGTTFIITLPVRQPGQEPEGKRTRSSCPEGTGHIPSRASEPRGE